MWTCCNGATGGSDVSGLTTEAVLNGDTWTLNGRKCFITNSHCAGVTVITCKTGEDEKGRAVMSTIAIEKSTEGFAPGRAENKMGLKGSYTGELIMNDVKVPLSNTIGEIGKGMPITMKELGEVGRASMCAIELGILRACLEDSVNFAKERILYGKPLSKLQAIQFHIAEIRCDYEASRLMVYNAATMKDTGAVGAEFSMAKYFVSEAAVRSAKRLIEIMGGYGFVNEYPAGRYLRDAMGCIPSCGTSEIQKLIIAGETLKKFGTKSDTDKGSHKRKGEELAGDVEGAAKAILQIIRKSIGTGLGKASEDISKAELILCGGFGIGSEENQKKLCTLTEKLGGTVGCTRAALDAGWGFAGNAMIGTSGITVSPEDPPQVFPGRFFCVEGPENI